ncbi:hypothetical protein ACJX0J_038749, partial [Zea mays]
SIRKRATTFFMYGTHKYLTSNGSSTDRRRIYRDIECFRLSKNTKKTIHFNKLQHFICQIGKKKSRCLVLWSDYNIASLLQYATVRDGTNIKYVAYIMEKLLY